MGKLLATIKYGSRKTKTILLIFTVLVVAAIGLFTLGAVFVIPGLMIGGAICALLAGGMGYLFRFRDKLINKNKSDKTSKGNQTNGADKSSKRQETKLESMVEDTIDDNPSSVHFATEEEAINAMASIKNKVNKGLINLGSLYDDGEEVTSKIKLQGSDRIAEEGISRDESDNHNVATTGKSKFYKNRVNKIAKQALEESENARKFNSITGRAEDDEPPKGTWVKPQQQRSERINPRTGQPLKKRADDLGRDIFASLAKGLGIRRSLSKFQYSKRMRKHPYASRSITPRNARGTMPVNRVYNDSMSGRRGNSIVSSNVQVRNNMAELREREQKKDKLSYVSRYTNEAIEDLKREYHIPKDNIPIVIDKYQRASVLRTPAFCWSKKGMIQFLLLEPEPRMIQMPYEDFKHCKYLKNVNEDDLAAYDNFRKNMQCYPIFADVMPTFNQGPTTNLGQVTYQKNLYVLGYGMAITPRSLRELLNRFDFEFDIFSTFKLKETYSKNFQKAYEQRVMLTDGVLSEAGYQENIRNILIAMVNNDKLTYEDFEDDLDKMIKYRLVTYDYGQFFRDKKYDKTHFG